MSGQFSKDYLKQHFGGIQAFLDLVAEGEFHPRFRLPEKLLRGHTYSAHHNWIHYYRHDPRELIRDAAIEVIEILRVVTRNEDSEIVQNPPGDLEKTLSIFRSIPDWGVLSELLSDRFRPVIMRARCIIVIAVCYLQYKCMTEELIQRAINRNEEAALSLIKLDPAFLTQDFVQDLIVDAEVSRNDGFFQRLRNALRPDADFWTLKAKRKFISLFLLYHMGDFAYRSDEDWADFLIPFGFEAYYDLENVRRDRHRYGLKQIQR
ncbi:hypothetical protein KQH82_04110 [bacterium]|nr:hypothetical protein [bacterium]